VLTFKVCQGGGLMKVIAIFCTIYVDKAIKCSIILSLNGAEMRIILIRGIPGSGKSTLARTLGIDHFEADQYFMLSGEYRFDASKFKQAHGMCIFNTRSSLESGRDVVVSNTFTQVWEIEIYAEMAKEFGAELLVITAKGNYKSVHDVPDEAVKRMLNRWEPYPGEIL